MIENNEFEIEFLENLVKEKPDYVEALIALANVYTKSGKYKKGLEIDKRLSNLRPEDPIVFYNLACSHSLLNHVRKAVKALDKAIRLGYDDVEYMLEDSDLENIKNRSEFKKLLKKYFKPSSPN